MVDTSLNPAYEVKSDYGDGTAMPASLGPELNMASAVTGAINNADPSQPINFCFNYGEVPILENIMPNGVYYQLSVNATVGHMPYTAEDRDMRALLQAAVNKLHQATNGEIYLSGQQAIMVSGDKKIEPPLTAVTIISGLVSLMVQVRPLFKAIGEFLPDLIDALPSKGAQ
ncbi:MAG: hypothetical protein ACI82H_000104 [Alphaproteobacteria bacterium]|jgi:hypothetical protein